jgi:hypothetical protein
MSQRDETLALAFQIERWIDGHEAHTALAALALVMTKLCHAFDRPLDAAQDVTDVILEQFTERH